MWCYNTRQKCKLWALLKLVWQKLNIYRSLDLNEIQLKKTTTVKTVFKLFGIIHLKYWKLVFKNHWCLPLPQVSGDYMGNVDIHQGQWGAPPSVGAVSDTVEPGQSPPNDKAKPWRVSRGCTAVRRNLHLSQQGWYQQRSPGKPELPPLPNNHEEPLLPPRC